IGGDEVPRADPVGAVAVLVTDGGSHTVAVLGQVDELVVEPDTAWVQLLGVLLEHRLETDLREVAGAAGAGSHIVRIGVPAAPDLEFAQLASVAVVGAGQTGIPPGRAHVLRRGAALIDLGRDTNLGE